MAEIQPPEGQINGGGGALAVTSSENVASKRQRRPSVRLGDIGDQTYETQVRRSNKQWKHHSFDHNNASGKSSKTRALMNLSSSGGGGGGDFHQTLDGDARMDNLDGVAIGSWNVKDAKKPLVKRVRSNWVSKIDEGGEEGDDKYSGGEDLDDGSRGFEQSPIHSLENLGVDEREVVYRRPIRDRVDMSDNDVRDWNGSVGRGRYGEDGMRIWLNSLGLGRYAPVFEIHEVDDQVLPLLTLEDLKDMGINAVGSRRKMYCAIQKLGKGFS